MRQLAAKTTSAKPSLKFSETDKRRSGNRKKAQNRKPAPEQKSCIFGEITPEYLKQIVVKTNSLKDK